jgi:DNA-binding MarR family transcriptional regulator
MARGKFITEFERDCIRIGKSEGIDNATIARALKRTPSAVGQQVKSMEEQGTIDQLPMIFMVEDIADMLRRSGSKR